MMKSTPTVFGSRSLVLLLASYVISGMCPVLTFLIYKMGIIVGLVAKLYECVTWYWTLIKHSEGLKRLSKKGCRFPELERTK